MLPTRGPPTAHPVHFSLSYPARQGREGKASGFRLPARPHPGDLLPSRHTARPPPRPPNPHPQPSSQPGLALLCLLLTGRLHHNWPSGSWPEVCSPSASPESQVKVRAESSVNMMATACLLVSLGSLVTHLTLLISVTWDSIHKGVRLEHPPLYPLQFCRPWEGSPEPQDSSSLCTG